MVPYLYPEEEQLHRVFNITVLKRKKKDIICVAKRNSKTCLLSPLMRLLPAFHLSHKHRHTNPLLRALIFEFIHYPYPSTSITRPITAPRPRQCTRSGAHTSKPCHPDTLHCQRIDYQCAFYWHVWGADTSVLALLILLSYPNEPCVIHHCSAGSTQPAWMAGSTELKRDMDYHLATGHIYQWEFPEYCFSEASTVKYI